MLALEGKAGLLSPGPYSLGLKGIPCIEVGLVLSVSEFYSLNVCSVPPRYSMVSLGDSMSSVTLEDEGSRLEQGDG